MKKLEENENIDLLKELISEVLTERKRKIKRKTRSKPGGGLTDMGALKRVSPGRFVAKVKAAVETSSGDVEKAAAALDAAPRTLYYWMEDPSFSDIKLAKKKEQEEEEKKEKEKEKEKKEREEGRKS